MQIIAHALETVGGFRDNRGVMGQRAEGINHVEQQTLLSQRIVGMP